MIATILYNYILYGMIYALFKATAMVVVFGSIEQDYGETNAIYVITGNENGTFVNAIAKLFMDLAFDSVLTIVSLFLKTLPEIAEMKKRYREVKCLSRMKAR